MYGSSGQAVSQFCSQILIECLLCTLGWILGCGRGAGQSLPPLALTVAFVGRVDL